MIKVWKSNVYQPDREANAEWWAQIEEWRAKDCLAFEQTGDEILPQYLLERFRGACQISLQANRLLAFARERTSNKQGPASKSFYTAQRL